MTDFPIPEAAFNEDAVICAKKGSGKTVHVAAEPWLVRLT